MRRYKSGFTIVELLIVIVVIAILATITIVAYNGIQKRALDTQRISDIKNIQKGLMAYKAINGVYPTATPASVGAWDSSADYRDGHVFLQNLKDANVISAIPVDPKNVSYDSDNTDGYQYAYYTYTQSELTNWLSGCPTDRGKLAILMIQRFASSEPPAESPGFKCGPDGGNGDFSARYPNAWIWGDFDN